METLLDGCSGCAKLETRSCKRVARFVTAKQGLAKSMGDVADTMRVAAVVIDQAAADISANRTNGYLVPIDELKKSATALRTSSYEVANTNLGNVNVMLDELVQSAEAVGACPNRTVDAAQLEQ